MKTETSGSLNRKLIVLAAGLGMTVTLALAGCQGDQKEENQLLANSTEPETIAPSDPSYLVEREFWLALAEEPRWHMDTGRDLFQEKKYDLASIEFAKAASILNFECRHSHSPREEGLLLGSVDELRELSRDLRYREDAEGGLVTLKEMDEVEARAFRAIAAHQVALARDALEEGDARTAGALSRETAHAVEAGFLRSGVEMGEAMTKELENAREVGLRMQLNGDGTRMEGLGVLDDLDAAVRRLGTTVAVEEPE